VENSEACISVRLYNYNFRALFQGHIRVWFMTLFVLPHDLTVDAYKSFTKLPYDSILWRVWVVMFSLDKKAIGCYVISRWWKILILTQISTIILKFISQSLCPVTKQDRKCPQNANFLELSSPHFSWILKSWAVSRRTLNLRDLGICLSKFYPTHSINFLCILASERYATDSCFLFFILRGWDSPLTWAKI